MYFLQLQGGVAPLTPLYGRLISSLPDFFSSPVPIPGEREKEREKERERWRERVDGGEKEIFLKLAN